VRKEYDLRDGKPNPYAKRLEGPGRAAILERFLRSEHFVRLDPDVAETFTDDASVNATLRLALQIGQVAGKPQRAKSKPMTKKSA